MSRIKELNVFFLCSICLLDNSCDNGRFFISFIYRTKRGGITAVFFPSFYVPNETRPLIPAITAVFFLSFTYRTKRGRNAAVKSTFYKSMFYKSTFYKSTFYKSTLYKSIFTNPCFTNPPFTNPVHVLQIQSNPVHSLFYNMPSVTNPRSLQIVSHGHVRLSSSFKDFVARYSLLVFFSSLVFGF